jgi:hypothetical protein
MGALAGGKMLAFFHQQELPIEPLSNPSLGDLRVLRGYEWIFSACSAFSVVRKAVKSVCSAFGGTRGKKEKLLFENCFFRAGK